MSLSQSEQQQLRALISQRRWACLATCDDKQPNGAMVAYAVAPDSGGLLIYISRMSLHTRQLLTNPFACLVISEAEIPDSDPQTLFRVAVHGHVAIITRDDIRFAAAQHAYCHRLPDSARLFGFADFVLFELQVHEVRVIAGFGRAVNVSGENFSALFREPVSR
jgi:nitroimidazol reductase NimA-like FMN-containing flavoprotein (pyridoxamine 5'-phosphate oxidase superfamily)